MRNLITLTILASSLPLLAQDEIHWLGDYQQARAEARRTGKPIFLEFRCEA
jgi:hypothetical protein